MQRAATRFNALDLLRPATQRSTSLTATATTAGYKRKHQRKRLTHRGVQTMLGLDASSAPTKKELEIAWRVGARWLGFYLPCHGRSQPPWPVESVKLASEMGFLLLPIYVPRRSGFTRALGRNEGIEASAHCQAYGFQPCLPTPENPVCLDIEGYMFDEHGDSCLEYIDGWTESVRKSGYIAVLYANPRTLVRVDRLPNRPDQIWAARYVPPDGWLDYVPPAPDVTRIWDLDNSLWDGPRRAWQYHNLIKLDNKEWDANISAEGFRFGRQGRPPTEDDMGYALEKAAPAGTAVHFAGCYNGPLANNRARRTFVALYAPVADHDTNAFEVDIVTSGELGPVGPDGKSYKRVCVLKGKIGQDMDTAITWIEGSFGLSVYNRADPALHPDHELYVTVKAEDSVQER